MRFGPSCKLDQIFKSNQFTINTFQEHQSDEIQRNCNSFLDTCDSVSICVLSLLLQGSVDFGLDDLLL